MKRFGVTSAVLTCACLLTLTACGGGETATTAGSTPTASAAPASAAAAPSAAATSAAPASTATVGDKELCASVKKAGDDMKKSLITALQSGEPSPAVFKKILTEMHEQMTMLAATGGDSKVAAAMTTFGAEAAKAAKAADPAGAADNPAFEKAGASITAACKPTGINVNF